MVRTSSYLLQMMFSIFLNSTKIFPGIECEQAVVVVVGTEKITNFAGALT